MKILVVEDEKKVASFLKKSLEQEYYTVDVTHDGKAGLDLSLTEEYDPIILDIMLPLLDGITLLREIRNAKLDVPVLMLTAKDSTEDKVEGLDSGADDYLAKPFALEELLARVRALIRRKVEIDNQLKSQKIIEKTETNITGIKTETSLMDEGDEVTYLITQIERTLVSEYNHRTRILNK